MDTYGDDDIYEVLDLDSLGAAMQVLLPTEQDIGLDDSSADTATSSSSATTVATSNTSAPTGRANTKTPRKSVSASVITGIGRPGAVKPIELKTSTSLSSTPNRSAVSSASTSVATPGSKADDSDKTAADDKLNKVVRGTPHRATKNGPSSTTSSNTSNDVSQASSNANKVPGSSASSASAPSPTVSEKSLERKLSPQTQRTPPPARTPPPKAPAAPASAAPAAASAAAVVKDRSASSTPNSTASSSGIGSGGPLSSVSSVLSGANGTLGSQATSGLDEQPVLSEEQRQIMRMIDESFHFIPESLDSEKVNRYVPRNLYPTPASFPTTPLSEFDNATVFEKLDVDTLFFIFYYQQGSYQQYLAARELKRRTWGYHKKYKTWFKRHEEPQVTGEDYEQGTFVYFDYETGWCQRIKTEFTFEYSYLEDELL